MWEFLVAETDRLDRILRGHTGPGAEWLSRQAWDTLIQKGNVRVEGKRAPKAGAQVEKGSKITVHFPTYPLGLLPAARPATLVWGGLEEGFGFFCKESGLSSHPLFPWEQDTFANQVVTFLAGSKVDFANLAERPKLEGGLFQRLDFYTSGLLGVAFTPQKKKEFRERITKGDLEKEYLAIVKNALERPGKQILFFGPSGAERVKVTLEAEKQGAEAVELIVEVLAESAGNALVKVKTRQGQRHVVRAGLAALGCPLLGDKLYDGGDALAHYHLHASALRMPLLPELKVSPPKSFLESCTALGLHLAE